MKGHTTARLSTPRRKESSLPVYSPGRSLAVLSEGLVVSLIALFAAVNVAFYTGAVGGRHGTTGASQAADAPIAAGTPGRPDLVAESDASAGLPGHFVPTQGRQHIQPYPRETVAFCPPPGKVRNNCYASNSPTSGSTSRSNRWSSSRAAIG